VRHKISPFFAVLIGLKATDIKSEHQIGWRDLMDRDIDRIFEFMLAANKTKQIKRTGWVRNNVKNPEHVGDHCFSTALLSYLMADYLKLDKNKCLLMGLTHDLNEVITGDIASRATQKLQRISNIEKMALEDRNTVKVLSALPKRSRIEILDAWRELSAGKTKEAKLVKQVDQLDYILLLMDYAKQFKNKKSIDEFFLVAGRRINAPELVHMYQKVRKALYKKQ
jgi:putative hydrolase of HD superfamily